MRKEGEKKPRTDGKAGCARIYLKGTAMAVALCLILLGVFSALLVFTDCPETYMAPFVAVVMVLSALFSGALCAKNTQQRGIVAGAIAGAAFFLALFAIGALSAMPMKGFGGIMFYLVVTLLFGVFGGILGANLKRARRKK